MEKKQNVPALRFQEFSSEWKSHQLQSFGKATGGTPIESEFVSQGKYKVISIGSYSEQGTYIDQGIRANYSEKTAKRILNKDDLAMLLNDKTLRGNIIGRVLLIDADDSYVYNQRTERLEVDKDNFNPSFLHCLFNVDKIRKAIIYNAVGITQIHVNWSAISQLFYHIPPTMAEQNCISNFNIEYSQFILLQKNKIRKLQQFRRAMLAKLFPREGAAEPELRFRGFSGKWKRQKLADVVDVQNGYDYKSLGRGTIPVYGTGGYMLSVDKALSYDKDAIGIGRKGTIDKPFILKAPFWTVDTLFYAIPREINDINFVLCLFQKIDWKSKNESTGVPSLSKTTIEGVKILIPSAMEQKVIGDFFYRLDRYISLQQKKLERMQRLKAALLGKMFV